MRDSPSNALVCLTSGGGRRSLAALTFLAVAAFGAGCAEQPVVRADAAPAGWTTYRDVKRGFEVQFPSDWRRAQRSLTPNLFDPRELVSLGTGLLRPPGPKDCAHMPQGALEAMTPSDVLVSIQERRAAGNDDHAQRPAALRLDRAKRATGLQCADPKRQDLWWLTFGDRGRGFYALVAVGHNAPPARRRQAQRVLTSLRLDATEDQEAG